MLLLLPIIWIILNGRITLEILIFAAILTAAIYFFMCNFLSYSLKMDLKLLKIAVPLIGYLGLLLTEIIKANSCVIKIIFKGKSSGVQPVIIKFKTYLKHDAFRAMLANSITLTPGTITVSLRGDDLIVHCLDKSLAEGIESTVFEKRLEKLEKRWDGNA